MASFLEDLWKSVFTPGPTPTLLIATNVTFAALELLLLALLAATFSIHFLVLSVIAGGLWYSINWFARELQTEKAKEELSKQQKSRERSPDPDSETETEASPVPKNVVPVPIPEVSSSSLKPVADHSNDSMRKRRSLGDSSGYVSTDSEWEKVSEGEERTH